MCMYMTLYHDLLRSAWIKTGLMEELSEDWTHRIRLTVVECLFLSIWNVRSLAAYRKWVSKYFLKHFTIHPLISMYICMCICTYLYFLLCMLSWYVYRYCNGFFFLFCFLVLLVCFCFVFRIPTTGIVFIAAVFVVVVR